MSNTGDIQLAPGRATATMTLLFAGVDGEMTGGDVRQHCLLQIGVALSEGLTFNRRISCVGAAFEEEALRVIGITPQELGNGDSAAVVDAALVDWLAENSVGLGSLVPIGWGVSDFDRPFIAKALPRAYTYFHHHSIELNALTYLIAGTTPYLDACPDFHTWKRMSKRIAELSILHERGSPPRPHDACDDALAALLSYNWLRSYLARATGMP